MPLVQGNHTFTLATERNCSNLHLCHRDPLVVPFYHTGMGIIQPRGSTLPRVGRQLHVTIGQPLPLGDLTCRCGRAGEDQQQVRANVRLGSASRASQSILHPRCSAPLAHAATLQHSRHSALTGHFDEHRALAVGSVCGMPTACSIQISMLSSAVLQVWMDITARVRAALADLEAQSPPNNSQLRPGATCASCRRTVRHARSSCTWAACFSHVDTAPTSGTS